MVNGFFVISGRLKVTQEHAQDIILEGNSDWANPRHSWMAVETRSFHRFEALEDTVVVETYGRVDIKRMRHPT